MGGYAAYIWPAYGLSLIVLVGLVLWSLSAYRKAERRLGEAGAVYGSGKAGAASQAQTASEEPATPASDRPGSGDGSGGSK